MVEYCKQPFSYPQECALVKDDKIVNMEVLLTDMWKAFPACGIWSPSVSGREYELCNGDGMFFYVCRNCLLKQGLIW